MLAVVVALKHFRCYLIGKEFLVRTDRSSLQWLSTFKEPVGQVARWLEQIAEYDFEIVHRPGKQHANADALSRYPLQVDSITASEQWVHPNHKSEFRKLQAKDSVTATLLSWLKRAARPDAREMEGVSRDLRYYWARFDELVVEDGILGITVAVEDGPTNQFCAIVPHAAR